MTAESLQNVTAETEDLCQLPIGLVFDPVVRIAPGRHEIANHLAIYVLRQWKRSVLKQAAFRPPVGYLEPIYSMPIDIIYEILGHLHPIDLYHISQTNRAFRTLLRHPSSSSAWNLAFENNPDIPRCPPETPAFPTKMSGLEWAGMLFGKHICQICGGGGGIPLLIYPFVISGALIALLCMIMSSSGSQEFGVLFFSLSLVDMVPRVSNCSVAYTLVRKSQVFQFSRRRDVLNLRDPWYIYSEAEVLAAHEVVTVYEDAIERKELGSKEAFEAYQTKQGAELDLINEHSAAWLRWAKGLRICYVNDLKRNTLNIMKRIRSRFKRLGYHPEDIGKAAFNITFRTSAPRLSNKQWETIKPLLEPAILRVKNERRAREREILIAKRKEFVHELYREYKKSASPLTRAYLPPHAAVSQFMPFVKLINAQHDEELDKGACEDALRCLPKEIDNWTVKEKRQLVSRLPRRSAGGAKTSLPEPKAGSTSGTSGPFQEPEADFSALHLVTSVFCCPRSCNHLRKGLSLLIGWEETCPHLRCRFPETYSGLYFSQRGYDAASALVSLACLDPRTATTTDMDRLDHRYICSSCPVVAFSGFKGRLAYNWRDAVLHYIKRTDVDDTQAAHPTPTWSLLTTEAEADIKRREGYNRYAVEHSWSCTLCPKHFHNLVPREEAINHVKSKHNIPTPVENTDFSYLTTREGRTPGRRVGFPQSPPSDYTCTHCVSRMYNMNCMLRHLRRSHQIEKPFEGKDWVHVQTVLRSAPPISPTGSLL